MNNCYHYEELISKYIENELNSEAKQQFDKHLFECSNCASKVKHFKALRSSLASLPAAKVSFDFDDMLRARIHLEQRQEKRRRESLLFSWKVRGPLFGLSAALVIFILLTVFSQLTDNGAFSPKTVTKQSLKEGQFAQQGAAKQETIIYWIDRKPALEIVTVPPLDKLRSKNVVRTANSDSSIFAENNPRQERTANFYLTSF